MHTILNEDIDLIFDGLVIGDYIKDEEEAVTTHMLQPG